MPKSMQTRQGWCKSEGVCIQTPIPAILHVTFDIVIVIWGELHTSVFNCDFSYYLLYVILYILDAVI